MLRIHSKGTVIEVKLRIIYGLKASYRKMSGRIRTDQISLSRSIKLQYYAPLHLIMDEISIEKTVETNHEYWWTRILKNSL